MNGADIAAEITSALGEASVATGDGPLICTLRKPGTGGPTSPHDTTPEPADTLHEMNGLSGSRQLRDASGTLIGKTIGTLTLSATGVEPKQGEQIAVGVAMADVTNDTLFQTIAEVRPLAPGGVALSYDVDMET